MDPNAALKQTVREFLERDIPPHYGLLITGEWGVGKTHIIKSLLQERDEDPPSFYISLSGCASKADFDQALFSAVYGHLDNPITQLLGTALKAATNADAADFKRFLSTTQQGAYVFDDLERANGMSLIELLRHVNELVEHSSARVIVVANPETVEADDLAVFNAQKEKTIGRTLKVRPDLDAAFECFVDGVSSEPVRTLFRREADALKDVFRAAGRHVLDEDGQPRLEREAGFNNLRTLQQALWDIEAILMTQPDFATADSSRLRAFVEYILVMAVHTKNGNLSEDNLPENRDTVQMRKFANVNLPYEADHPDVDLETIHLRKHALSDALFRGHFDADAIGEDFQRTVTPQPSADTPPWLILMEFFERPRDEVDEAVDRLHQQLANYEITELGEILHVVSLRLWLADIEAIEETAQSVQEQSIDYIDELARRGTLPALDGDHYDRQLQSYGGWRITEREFLSRVRSHLQSKAEIVYAGQLDAKGQEMLDALPQAPELVRDALVGAGNPDPNYAFLPILAHVDPEAFAAALLALPVPEQLKTGNSIGVRYAIERVRHELRAEETFVRGLDAAIGAAANGDDLSPIEKDRLRKLRQWSLSEAIQHFDAARDREAEAAGDDSAISN